MMKKIILIPIISTLAFFANVAHAQFLPPPPPDAVGYVEVAFEGSAHAIGGDFFAQATIFDIPEAVDNGIEPDTLYNWCLEIGGIYFPLKDIVIPRDGEIILLPLDGIQTDLPPEKEKMPFGKPFGAAFELGEATPSTMIGLLLAVASEPTGNLGDLIDFYNGATGLNPIGLPPFLGLEADDIDFDLILDEDGLLIAIGSDDADPEAFVEFGFFGQARLSAKPIPGGVVPEPSTYGMIGAGFLIALVAIRRRKFSVRN